MKISGRIEFYNPKRGFGFLKDVDDPCVSRFFHHTHVISGTPQIGRLCTYEPGETSKGAVALAVEVLGGAQ